jgi:uncharacterized protein
MQIKELWRYPVKSMAGEMLQTAEITPTGIAGDRTIQVRNAKGGLVTARTKPLLLRHHARLADDGMVLIDGKPWTSPDIANAVTEAAGPNAHLVSSLAEDRFDILPLLVCTDGMINTTGYDRRRFRPNIVIGGVDGRTEQSWENSQLRIGDVVIGMEDLRDRCVMTTFDPDSGEQDLQVLRTIYKHYECHLCLNSYVVHPGRISVGDPVVWMDKA